MYLDTFSLNDDRNDCSGGEATRRSEFAAMNKQSNAFFAALLGEERPGDMLILLTTLVLLLHVWMIIWLLRPNELSITPPQPLPMTVSMISISDPKPSIAQPPPAQPPPMKKAEPKKLPVKPVPKTAQPKAQEPLDIKPVEQAAEPSQSLQAPPSSPANSSSKAETISEQPFTEANFKAKYLNNPSPDYPSMAKDHGWQGRVRLRVQVSAEGLSLSVRVENSSGHEILDDAAIEAVKQWRFIPAKRGETIVASSVVVPITFNLQDD